MVGCCDLLRRFVGRDDHGAPLSEGHCPGRRSRGDAEQFYKCQGERLSEYEGRDDAYYLCAGYSRRQHQHGTSAFSLEIQKPFLLARQKKRLLKWRPLLAAQKVTPAERRKRRAVGDAPYGEIRNPGEWRVEVVAPYGEIRNPRGAPLAGLNPLSPAPDRSSAPRCPPGCSHGAKLRGVPKLSALARRR